MSIRRVDHGRGHSYVTDTGEKVPGVTTIIGDGMPKPALVIWAANATAEYAIDHWAELDELPPSQRLKKLQGARYAVKDAAANRGTVVHRLAEKLIRGDRVSIPEGLEGHVQSYVQFLDDYDVQPVLVEKTIFSAEHFYCGTFDLICDLLQSDDPDNPDAESGRHRWLLDIKTNKSGIFGETGLQLAAYRYADMWIDEETDEEHPIPEVTHTGAVHVRADGYDLVPLTAGEQQHRQFLYCQQNAEFVRTSRYLVGEPVTSAYTSTYRLVRDE